MLGKRIRALRKANRLSQVSLAAKLGVSKQSISNWENGNILPSIDMLIRIADVFSVSTDYLLGRDKNHYLKVDGLSSDKMAFIQRMISYLQETPNRK